MPLPNFSPLPELGKEADKIAAVVVAENAILFLRQMAHADTYLRLPGGWSDLNDSFEVSCRRLAVQELREAVRELSRQLHVSAEDEMIGVTVEEKIGQHVSGRLGRDHYFLVRGSGHSLFAGPSAEPQMIQRI